MKALFIIGLALTACAEDRPLLRTPELDRLAISIVWHGSFQRTDDPPPVEFVEMPECETDGWSGLKIYHSLTAWSCARGYTIYFGPEDPHQEVRVFYQGQYSKSPLTHELNHALIARTSDFTGDVNHADSRFWDGSEQAARAELVREGL